MEKIYKGAVFSENIHPNKVMKALYFLLQKSELYQMEDIHIDDDWRERLVAQEEMQGNDHYFNEKTDAQDADYQEDHIQGKSDTDEEPNAPSINTMFDDLHVDNNNMSLSFAPGHQEKVNRQFFMSLLLNTFAFLQYFVDKSILQIMREHIQFKYMNHLSMNCVLLILEWHQIFQIFFGKSNINK